jgi:ribosomal protein L37AE/L43A
MIEIECLSELLAIAQHLRLTNGTEVGKCGFCGKSGSNFFLLKMKDSFTQFEYFQNSKYICPACQHLYIESKYRTNIWLCTPNEFAIIKRNEVLTKLLAITKEDCPFSIYTTDSYKKQGWLTLLRSLNYSSEKFVIGWDMLKITSSKNEVSWLKVEAEIFRSLGLTKSEILTGRISMKNLKNIADELSVLRKLESLKPKLIWQWVVAFIL